MGRGRSKPENNTFEKGTELGKRGKKRQESNILSPSLSSQWSIGKKPTLLKVIPFLPWEGQKLLGGLMSLPWGTTIKHCGDVGDNTWGLYRDNIVMYPLYKKEKKKKCKKNMLVNIAHACFFKDDVSFRDYITWYANVSTKIIVIKTK